MVLTSSAGVSVIRFEGCLSLLKAAEKGSVSLLNKGDVNRNRTRRIARKGAPEKNKHENGCSFEQTWSGNGALVSCSSDLQKR